MTWLRIDDGFVEHPRVEPLTDKAFRLHVTGMCLCARKLTDGWVSAKDTRLSMTISGSTRRQLDMLVKAGLWIPNGSGYDIRDYLDYNPTAEKVRADREKARERMREVRANVPANVQANTRRTSAERSGSPSRPLISNTNQPTSIEDPPQFDAPQVGWEEHGIDFETILADVDSA